MSTSPFNCTCVNVCKDVALVLTTVFLVLNYSLIKIDSRMVALFLITFLAVISSAFSTSCSNVEVISKSFTTQDATIVTNIAYISEFTLKCGSGAVSHLYADVDGILAPVSEVAHNKYQVSSLIWKSVKYYNIIKQVSWTEDTKTAQRGDITIRLFDEDGYTALRKLIRAGEDISTVTPLFTVTVNHPGAFNGPWLKSEFLAAALSLVVAYLALSSRSKLLS